MALATVGNVAGKILATFTAAGQDTGSLCFEEVPTGYKARTFQLVGTGSGQVTIYGTLDQGTAQGSAGATIPYGPFWDELPAPSTETSPSWSNPLISQDGYRLFFCSAPLVAVRAVSANPPAASWSGTLYLLMLAAN